MILNLALLGIPQEYQGGWRGTKRKRLRAGWVRIKINFSARVLEVRVFFMQDTRKQTYPIIRRKFIGFSDEKAYSPKRTDVEAVGAG